MQLREIFIDGFGIFSTKKISGFKQGLNVIFGQNEQGKSTLRAFIERIFFGFPSKTIKKNPYPALAGGGYGGKLICVLSDGKEAIIVRNQSGKKAEASVTINSKQLKGDDEIRDLLGNISGTFYHNVYSFDLDEFAILGSLNDDDLRQRVYGAAEGLNSVSISTVKEELQKRADEIYKKSGQNPVINKLLARIGQAEKQIVEMRRELSNYDQLVDRRQNIHENNEMLKTSHEDVRSHINDLTSKKALFKPYVDMIVAQGNLAALPEVPEISVEESARMGDLVDEIKELDKDIMREEEQKSNLEQVLKELNYNRQLIEKENTVNELIRNSELYSKAVGDLNRVTSERDSVQESIEGNVNKLGVGWTKDKAREFDLTHLQTDIMRLLSARLNDATEIIRIARGKLAIRRDQLALDKPRINVWNEVNIPLIVLAAASAIGIAIGLLLAQPGLSIFSGLFLIAFVVLVIVLKKGRVSTGPDALEQQYLNEVEEAEQERGRVETEWRDHLVACNLDARLSPEGVKAVVDSIEEIQGQLVDYESLRKRVMEMESTIKSVEDLYQATSRTIEASSLSGDIGSDIKLLSSYLAQAKSAESDARNQQKEIEAKSRTLESLRRNKDIASDNLRELLASYDCAEVDTFNHKYETCTKRTELNNEIATLKQQIQYVTGLGERYDVFIESLANTDIFSIETSLTEASEKVKQLGKEIDENNVELGSLDNQLKRLTNELDISQKQDQLEQLKQQLYDACMDWLRFQAAVTLIEKAMMKYEKTGQPEVLKDTAVFFKAFTSGAYTNVYKPAEEDVLRVIDVKGLPKGVEVLSTGTKQQLYLAIRFGLVQACERQSEPMPIIMDDLLVNFDDMRTPETIKHISNFAKERQIIYLTCHGSTRDALRKAGANLIVL